jgi:hypothetical protein
VVDEAGEVIGLEIRDTDYADPPVGVQLLEALPGVNVAIVPRRWPMDQVEIDAVEPEEVEALPCRPRQAVHGQRSRAWW